MTYKGVIDKVAISAGGDPILNFMLYTFTLAICNFRTDGSKEHRTKQI